MNDVENERTEMLCVRVLRQYIRQYNHMVRSLYVTLVLLIVTPRIVSIIPINSLTSPVC